jgi:hypothetical protein
VAEAVVAPASPGAVVKAAVAAGVASPGAVRAAAAQARVAVKPAVERLVAYRLLLCQLNDWRHVRPSLSEWEQDCQAWPAGASLMRHLIKSLIGVVLLLGAGVCTRAQDAQPKNTDESWTTSTQTHVDNTTPLRTTVSHTTSGNRSMDKQRVEVLGPDGRYQPDSDTETETIQVNATTTRKVVRTFRWDANGQRYLAQVIEEQARTSAGGDAEMVRTTSSSDVNGNLQVTLREVADTKKTSQDTRETRTMVYLADGNGGFTPTVQTQELQKRKADDGVEVRTTTLLPGANGHWELGEVREKRIKRDGNDQTIEDRVSRPDSEGELSEYSRTVGQETANAAGEKSNTVETYSTYVPGLAQDGGLHLNQRITTTQNNARRNTTEEGLNPGNRSDGLQVTAKTKYTVQYADSGAHQTKTKTVEVRDANGTFKVVSDETQKSDEVLPAHAPLASPDTPRN